MEPMISCFSAFAALLSRAIFSCSRLPRRMINAGKPQNNNIKHRCEVVSNIFRQATGSRLALSGRACYFPGEWLPGRDVANSRQATLKNLLCVPIGTVSETTMIPTLDEAFSLMFDRTTMVARETVELELAMGRISSEPLLGHLPVPGYDQSTRDGFVLGPVHDDNGQDVQVFRVCGEIPAGRVDLLRLGPQEAYRIMTGGLVPAGAQRVVPQEACLVTGELVEVPVSRLVGEPRFIQPMGSWIGAGETIVAAGTTLQVESVAILAATGSRRIPVFRRPRAGFVCSGSELVAPGEPVVPGRKMSSNRYLLDGLLTYHGAESIDFGIIADDRKQVEEVLQAMVGAGCDLIVSTGGVGPGKYDLFAAAFQNIGGELHFRKLAMRPGRSMLFGTIGRSLYIGLPGPPSAVAVLFNELVGPVLDKMKGLSEFRHQDIKARLTHDITLHGDDLLTLQEGRLTYRDACILVQSVGRLEVADCCMLLEPGKRVYECGATVTVHRYLRR